MRLVRSLDESNLGIHALMVVQGGEVLSEHYWAPYASHKPHTLFSVSKTLTALAVGFAIQDGCLGMDDCVVSYFRDLLPAKTCENMEKTTIRHLMTMSTGFAADPHDFNWPRDTDVLATGPHCYYNGIETHTIDWAKNFFNHYVPFEPGKRFMYCTHASYMLAVLVQRATGQTAHDYLKDRLFEPLGIAGTSWEKCPQGYNVGGWGLMMKLEDLAKIGLFLLHSGQWQGKQLLDAQWVYEATTPQVLLGEHHRQDSNINFLGYGYQLWVDSRAGAFSARGAFGQGCLVLRQQDAVITWFSGADARQSTKISELMWEMLIPALSGQVGTSVDGDVESYVEKPLCMPLPEGLPSPKSGVALNFSGKRYLFAPNSLGFTSITLAFGEKQDSLMLGWKNKEFSVPVGHSCWAQGKTCVPTDQTDTDVSILFESVSCAGAWQGDRYLLDMCFDETSYISTLEITYDNEAVVVKHHRNCSFMACTDTYMVGILAVETS